MSTGHHHLLYVHGGSPIHRLPAHVKIVATVLTVLAIVGTPREQVWAYALFALAVAFLVAVARIRPLTFTRRLLIEVPFVAFALLLPFVARGPRQSVLGVSLSTEGLWGAWDLLATGTLGVACSVLLAATTPLREIVIGLERLRLPAVLVQIMGFMIRYADVVGAEMRRMRIARESRGFVARDVRQWPVLARAAGSMFVRCFERGERVHLAMLSRGYTGSMPLGDPAPVPGRAWVASLVVPTLAASVCAAAWFVS